jgi:hypothetical protein
MIAELIIEDQPKPIIQTEVYLEALCGVNQKPTSMRAAPMPGLMHLALGTPKAGPRLPKRDRLHQPIPSDHAGKQTPADDSGRLVRNVDLDPDCRRLPPPISAAAEYPVMSQGLGLEFFIGMRVEVGETARR